MSLNIVRDGIVVAIRSGKDGGGDCLVNLRSRNRNDMWVIVVEGDIIVKVEGWCCGWG